MTRNKDQGNEPQKVTAEALTEAISLPSFSEIAGDVLAGIDTSDAIKGVNMNTLRWDVVAAILYLKAANVDGMPSKPWELVSYLAGYAGELNGYQDSAAQLLNRTAEKGDKSVSHQKRELTLELSGFARDMGASLPDKRKVPEIGRRYDGIVNAVKAASK